MSSYRYKRSILWVKRDIRLQDNTALHEAVAQSRRLAVVFFLEPGLMAASETSMLHIEAWWQALGELQSELRSRGGELYLPRGEVAPLLANLHADSPINAIFSHEETGSDITYQRDIGVGAWCEDNGVAWHEYPQNGVIRGLKDRSLRQPVTRQRLVETDPLPVPSNLSWWTPSDWPTTLPELSALGLEDHVLSIQPKLLQAVSESQAWHDLNSFLLTRGEAYSGGISSPNTADTAGSRLSVHLAWGTISLRNVFKQVLERSAELKDDPSDEAKQWRKSLRAFQSRLHWHDHFIQRLESEPEAEFRPLNPIFNAMQYDDDEKLLAAWVEGRTGMPMLDACMRCLHATGFINFRMRAMLVTTACFGLKLSWSTIMHPLARVFRDYEPGIHISQVQMQASVVGLNAVRIYSPRKQIIDQDPDCIFIKKWVPELRRFAPRSICDYENRKLGAYPKLVADIDTNIKKMRTQIYDIRRTDKDKLITSAVLEKHGSRKSTKKRLSKKRLSKKRHSKKS